MKRKLLTVSVAAYNAERYLEKCLKSFVDSAVSDQIEVIVVNDGSTDQTQMIAENFQVQYPDVIKVINKVNGGHGSTINRSIESATGKYYKIVDADDWVEKDGIEKLVRYIENSDCDLILNPYWEISATTGAKSQQLSPCGSDIVEGKVFALANQRDIMLYMHSLTFKTSIVKKMGSIIDENCFYVDMEYALFPLEFVESAIFLNFPVYDYLLGSATQSMAMDNMVKRRNQHLKVTKRLIQYYTNNSSRLMGKKNDLFSERLKYAVYNQYKIYYYMASSEAKEEMIAFDKWLKTYSHEIYKGPIGRFMKIVKFDRMTGWILWNVNVNLMKRAGIIIKA